MSGWLVLDWVTSGSRGKQGNLLMAGFPQHLVVMLARLAVVSGALTHGHKVRVGGKGWEILELRGRGRVEWLRASG